MYQGNQQDNLKLKCRFEITFSGIYPLHDVHIRKVKVMKRPRFDLNKLMDMHGEGSGELDQIKTFEGKKLEQMYEK